MAIADVLRKEQIKLDIQGDTKQQVLDALADVLMQSGALTDKKAFLDDVYEREAVSSTGIGNGIAIPHGKSKFVKETTVAIGRVSGGVTDWETFDDAPVTLVVLLAVDEADKTGGHVRLLSSMATQARKRADVRASDKGGDAGGNYRNFFGGIKSEKLRFSDHKYCTAHGPIFET